MQWTIHVAKRAEKQLSHFPGKDRERILAALQMMCDDPFSGHIVRLTNQPTAWRRRVGSYRIFFDLYPDQLLVEVVDISRRTSTTY
jgi:mRNA-degrading endonuclease RelE of RelBE toxin-antitoxin system